MEENSWRNYFATQSSKRDFLLKQLPKNARGAEIGVFAGDFSERILRIAKPQELHLIDPWQAMRSAKYSKSPFGTGRSKHAWMDNLFDSVLKRLEREIKAGKVIIHRTYSGKALKQIADDSLDFVYIDGNHLYEFVKKDLSLSHKKVRKGGIISGDNYAMSSHGWWNNGVKKAVDEFIKSKKCAKVFIEKDQYFLINKK